MTIYDLKQNIEKYRDRLKKSDGSVVLSGETGPASMGLIDSIVAVLEEQERRIQRLEAGGAPAILG